MLVVSKRCRLHVLSGKSNIENLWFVSLSCLRTQVLVRVPNFFRVYFWKKRRLNTANRDRTCAGISPWISSPTPEPLGYHSSFDVIHILMEFNSVLGLIFACIIVRFFTEDCRAGHCQTLRSTTPFRKSNWESLVRQSQLLANTSNGSCSQLLQNILLKLRSKAAGWARSCAGSSHWISSPTP